MLPLSSEEVHALLDVPGVVKRRDIPHLLRRVLATVVKTEAVRRNYDEELRRRTEALPRPGGLPTLSPEQAAKFLSAEQLTRLFDRFSQEKLAALDHLRERAEADQREFRERAEAVLTLLVGVLADTSLDEATRSALREKVGQLQAMVRNGTAEVER